ncbi:DUF4136 domain-containing protein [Coralloluteibacterium thermophilus]|uniref:DUF4136 domain-containing protein n=1 Tax=Coralloluteibacterium thermophilum TaxID=2707049 RepID=A0ABV9NHA9_9GAMM
MSPVSRWLARGAVLVLVALLAACATGPSIRTEVDPQADFSRYRSFAFYSPLAMDREGYSSFSTQRVKDATRREMEARGYVYDEANPDLWVNINAYLQERTDVYSMPTVDYAYYYSYRARGYFAVPYWRDRTQVTRYTEGTLNVDIVDVAQNRLVWEGVSVGRVANTRSPDERAARLDQSIAEIFAQYPFRAGSAGPVY